MKRRISILTLASLAVACSSINLSLAQLPPPNEAGVTMGHVHMVTPNVEAAKKVFVTMGGTVVKREGGSEERRVGKECTSWCRSRWSPDH